MVKKSHINDGMIVTKGDTLIELDQTSTDVQELEFVTNQIEELESKLKSFQTVYDAIDSGKLSISSDLYPSARDTLEVYKEKIDQIILEYNAQKQDIASSLSATNIENEKQIQVLEAEKAKATKQIEIWEKQKQAVRDNKDEVTVLDEQIKLNQTVIEQLDKQINKEKKAIETNSTNYEDKRKVNDSSLNQALGQLEADTKLELQSKIEEIKIEFDSLQQQKSLLTEKEKKYIIKAPITGVVQSEKKWEKHHSVQEGETLFSIVPSNESKQQEVLILVNNDDVRKLKKNQIARIELPSDNSNGTETYKGEIINISKEPIVDTENNVFSYYARAKINTPVTIPNGLQGKAFIVTNEVSSLKYFLSKLNLSEY
jgi:hypothetical protein